MIKKIDHIVITTSKVKECVAFYENLGFISKDEGERYELFAGDFKINVHIKNHELLPHATNIQTGSCDICFEITDNINDFMKKLEKMGIQAEIGVVARAGVNGSMRSIYLRDPDGNLVEFCSYE